MKLKIMVATKAKNRRSVIIANTLNVIVMFCSVALLILLSVEILSGSIDESKTLNIQLFVCTLLLIDYFYLLSISKNRWRFFVMNFIFLLVSIPYYNIIQWFDISVTPTQALLLRSIVFVRGGYGVVIMINWFTKSKITNLFITYLILLIMTTYFGSLIFYSLERGINSGLKNFADAIWWACMDVTTVGSSIEPVTGLGRTLAVLLAVMGVSMFPILTVYVTNYLKKHLYSRL